jgi:hypothetical protein
MSKKKKDVAITRRFNSKDLNDWQEQANLSTGGNLTLWIELVLNKEVQVNKYCGELLLKEAQREATPQEMAQIKVNNS